MISVIISTYNRSKILAKTLQMLKEQTFSHLDYELIVVDDGSTEDIASVVDTSAIPCACEVIRLSERSFNVGKPKNVAARMAKGDILLFEDCDIMFLRETLSHHYHVAKDGAISIGYNFNPLHFQHNWPNDISQLDPSQYYKDYRTAFEISDGEKAEEFPFRFCNTGNVAMPRSMFEQVGGFDESFTQWGFEDNELGYRLWVNNERFIFNNQAVGIHHPHLRHTFINNPYEKMGSHFLNLHPVYEVELLVAGYYRTYPEQIKWGLKIAGVMKRATSSYGDSLPFMPDILLGSSEMPGQKAEVRISLREEDKPDFKLLGVRLPFDDGSVNTLVISAYWRFLPMQMLNQMLAEAFRVSSRVWIQTLSSPNRVLDSPWDGCIDELLLIGSDIFEFKPFIDHNDIYEICRL